MHIAAASVPVELLDSSETVDDHPLMFTLSRGRLEEGLRSKIQGKNSNNKQV